MPASATHGKICYLEIPSADVERSVAFYRAVFGWNVRRRGDGRVPPWHDSATSSFHPRAPQVPEAESLGSCKN